MASDGLTQESRSFDASGARMSPLLAVCFPFGRQKIVYIF